MRTVSMDAGALYVMLVLLMAGSAYLGAVVGAAWEAERAEHRLATVAAGLAAEQTELEQIAADLKAAQAR